MIFTLTDRAYNPLDSYETSDYLIGKYVGSIIKSLDINILTSSQNVDLWTEGNYIMCSDSDGYKYWFTIYTAKDGLSDANRQLTAYSGTIDIVSEDALPIGRPSTPQPFQYYFDTIFFDTGITIGINEIADLTRTLEFESTDVSNAEMLQYVLNGFDYAEADLAVEFEGSAPSKVVLNVFKRIGKQEVQTLISDQDDSLTFLERNGSISGLATCLYAFGGTVEGGGDPITLVGKYYEELDEKGEIAYYSPTSSNRVFSVIGRKSFFVEIPGKENGEFDGYINRRYESTATSQDSLWAASLSYLKRIDQPSLSFEAKGHIDCNIGDTVQIVSSEIQPPVMMSARVLEYKFNEDDETRNEYVFGNYIEVKSNLDTMSAIVAELKASIVVVDRVENSYAISDQGITPPETGWSSNHTQPLPTKWLWVKTITYLSNNTNSVAYTTAYSGGDGAQGPAGEPGLQGIQGPTGAAGNGVSSTAITYQASSSGTTTPTGTWSGTVPAVSPAQYLWTRTVITYTNGSTATLYSVGMMGATGAKGSTGSTGPAGPATGIIEQATAPTNGLYVGMLWRDTDDGITRRWNGSSWTIFLFHADNISATNLAAITSNLGTINAGILQSADGTTKLDLNAKTLALGSKFNWDGTNLNIRGNVTVDDDLFMWAPSSGAATAGLHARLENGLNKLYIGWIPEALSGSYSEYYIGSPNQIAVKLTFGGDLFVNGTGGNVYTTNKKPTPAEIGAEVATVVGSSASGKYIKFADGTMICYNRLVVNSLAITAGWGSWFISALLNYTFPATFLDNPVVSVNVETTTGDIAIWAHQATTRTGFNGRFTRGAAATFNSVVSWQAVGRWK